MDAGRFHGGEVMEPYANGQKRTFAAMENNTLPVEQWLSNLKIKALNEMQQASIEANEQHADVILLSDTGSGKTLAFLLPILQLLDKSVPATQALVIVPSLFILDGVQLNSVYAWFTLAWVLALGLVATLPIGAVFGSLFSNPRNSGLIVLPIMGLVAISGIFYPISAMPEWVQGAAQVFPVYWLGLGMRSAMLPDGLSAVEIGESWRHLETVGVLGAWAVVGLVVAPMVLRRMARRESGSSIAERRDRAMQRVT